jgi:hypothetical protein
MNYKKGQQAQVHIGQEITLKGVVSEVRGNHVFIEWGNMGVFEYPYEALRSMTQIEFLEVPPPFDEDLFEI